MAISNRTKLVVVSILLFLLVLPLSARINFAQNDDWIYYRTIRDFLAGNFLINGYIEATFYTQGFMGMLFAKVFGVEKLPILTLVISVLNFAIFTKLVNDFYLKKFHEALLIGLLFFLSPFQLYSTFGFMTDNYYIFFFLISVWFTEKFLRTENGKSEKIYFTLLNLGMVAGFFVRQLSIITTLALVFYLLLKKRFRWAVLQAGIVTFLLVYYFGFYSKTANMVANHNFAFVNLTDIPMTYSFIITCLLYVAAFTAPLAVLLFSEKRSLLANGLITLATIAGVLIISNTILPQVDVNPHLFYFKNTVEQNGFFYGNTLGNKYELQNQDEIYFYWELIAKVALALMLVMLFINRKKLLNYYVIYTVLYLGLMSVMLSMYDRYLLVLIPVTILAVLSVKNDFRFLPKLALIVFLVWLAVIGYNFSMEFISLNNTLWNGSNDLVQSHGVKPQNISAGYAWRRTFLNQSNRFKYMFYFEPKEASDELDCCFKLYGTYNINFPYSMFKDSRVYLYKRAF